MKHTFRVTLIVLAMFFFAQILGLVIINNYVDKTQLKEGIVSFKELPLGLEVPETTGAESLFTIVLAIIIGTILALVLMRFGQLGLLKIWFFLAVLITLAVAFYSFVPLSIALPISVVLSLIKIFRPNFYVQNFTELFVYGGLAAIFVRTFPAEYALFTVLMLLVLISLYDAYAVWKSGHMIKLAKFQTKSKMFAGVVIPYSMPKAPKGLPVKTVKVKTAILGGGDIGFPLLFSGVIFRDLLLRNTIAFAFLKVLMIPVFAAIALGWLLVKADKDKFYPAMPFISLGCFLAMVVMRLAGFL